MGCPVFVNNESLPLVNHHAKDCDNDYDDYNTPNTSRADERTVAMNESTDKQITSTLRLRENVKRNKLAGLYKHLNVTDDLDLVSLN